MKYVDVDVKEWAEKYQITLDPIKCRRCGTDIPYTRPFKMKGFAGVSTYPCLGCGNDAGIFKAVPTSKKTKETFSMKNLMKIIGNEEN